MYGLPQGYGKAGETVGKFTDHLLKTGNLLNFS